MKKATFEYKIPNSNRVVRGIVTLNDDGKTNISIPDSRSYSRVSRYAVKRLAEEIVKCNFIHTAIIQLDIQNLDDKLITLLKKETESLKKQFLELTEKYAKESFERMQQQVKWTILEWYDAYGLAYEIEKHTGIPRLIKKDGNRFIYDKEYNKMDNDRNGILTTVNKGYESYLNCELKRANSHYESSIFKLAHRISQIGLNYDNIKMTTSHIGVNINTTITDGERTIKAWTIVASGPIQRPHYRYLVK